MAKHSDTRRLGPAAGPDSDGQQSVKVQMGNGDIEILVRLGTFFGVLLAMGVWEIAAPRRPLTVSKPLRWFSNLTLQSINALTVRAVLPAATISAAIFAQEQGWGLLNVVVLPWWIAVPVAVVVLDLAIYLQHVLFHAIPIFWRLHMVHHADLDLDVTTGVRFHTLEILLSMGIKVAVVSALGAPALAVLIFESLLNATSMFNHGNVRLPARLDRVLRLIVVTPDMHRVHHSVVPEETNRNFGFNLSWWDFLLGTYRPQPAAGHEGMTIGLAQFRTEQVEHLHVMVALPFVRRVDDPSSR